MRGDGLGVNIGWESQKEKEREKNKREGARKGEVASYQGGIGCKRRSICLLRADDCLPCVSCGPYGANDGAGNT